MKIEPPEEEFDPDTFDAAARAAAIEAGVEAFNQGDYYEAHESFERCWLAAEGGDSDFWKGLVQASICLDHLSRDNTTGARKLHTGMRRLLAPFLPTHEGFAVQDLLGAMQARVGGSTEKPPCLVREKTDG